MHHHGFRDGRNQGILFFADRAQCLGGGSTGRIDLGNKIIKHTRALGDREFLG